MPIATYNGHVSEKRLAVTAWQEQQFKLGTLDPPMICEACLRPGRAVAHCENYDDPCNFTGLCQTCHLMLHSRHRCPDAWSRYKLLVAIGYQHTPGRTPFIDVKQTVQRLAWQPPPFDQHAPRETYLDTLELRQHEPGTNLNYGRQLRPSPACPDPAPYFWRPA